MTERISKLVQGIEPSPTLAVDAAARRLRAEGHQVLSLGAGQPDFATPEPICMAAIDAIRRGAGQYTNVEGTAEVRRAVVAKLERDQGLEYAPEQIVVSNGAKHSLYNALLATVDPGDGVLIPVPYWVSYPAMVHLAGGRAQLVEGDIKISADALEAAVDPGSRVLMLNSPCNPSGAVYSRAELEALAEVVRRHDLLVITDEIYEKIVYEDVEHLSLATVAPDLRERIILINGVSKTYAMTGWRIGYAAASVELTRAMTKLQGQTTGNACAVSQAATIAALELPDAALEPMLGAYRRRRAAIVDGLARIPGLAIQPPDGTFYAFAEVSGLMQACGCATSVELAGRLLEKVEVAAVPGGAFGCEGFMRFSFATSQAVIEEAVGRIAAFAADPS